MTRYLALLLLALLVGCGAQGKRVQCDERLEPINQPAPAPQRVAGPSSEPAPRAKDQAKEAR